MSRPEYLCECGHCLLRFNEVTFDPEGGRHAMDRCGVTDDEAEAVLNALLAVHQIHPTEPNRVKGTTHP